MIVSADAKQLEWRTAVELCNDSTGLREILEELDTHSLNQAEFHLPSRLIAKIYLFRTIFRGSGWAFANDPDFSHVSSDPKFWDRINEKFYAKYHGLDETHHRWKDMVMSGEPIQGPLGRAWSINIPRNDRGELKIPWTTLTNYPVQGTGADLMKIARIALYKRLEKHGLLSLAAPITTVHDSIVLDCGRDHLDLVTGLIHESFAAVVPTIKRIFGYEWRTPIQCEIKVGPNFKDLKPIA